MTDLFTSIESDNLKRMQPLAARMRPCTLDDVVGQDHLLAPHAIFRRLLEARGLGSVILFGPPGCGKTTVAGLLAGHLECRFQPLNAISTGVKEIRESLDQAREEVRSGGPRTLVFIDELHRLHRGQQEVMLREVEEGVIVLVGATTANPFFAVSSALISRSQVCELRQLSAADVEVLLARALADSERGLGGRGLILAPSAAMLLGQLSDGDARRAYQALELAAAAIPADEHEITPALVREVFQRRAGVYDRSEDAHYDHASALIKSIRGSDPDASIYWLARMLEAGEDVRFLCRRLVILASEDVGNADPQALVVAVAAMQACEFVGLPECQLPLAQAVTYLACAFKSNASTAAIAQARHDVREGRIAPVPMRLRDSHSASARQRGHGEGYQYAHDVEGGIVAQDYLGIDREYYQPVPRGFEADLAIRLQEIRSILRRAKVDSP